MPTAISDWLIQHGWRINEARQRFETAHDSIPFSELRLETLESFQAKAARKGWVVPEPPPTERLKSFAEKLREAMSVHQALMENYQEKVRQDAAKVTYAAFRADLRMGGWIPVPGQDAWQDPAGVIVEGVDIYRFYQAVTVPTEKSSAERLKNFTEKLREAMRDTA